RSTCTKRRTSNSARCSPSPMTCSASGGSLSGPCAARSSGGRGSGCTTTASGASTPGGSGGSASCGSKRNRGYLTMAAFRKATKQQSRLRMALIGPSGSGKTYTALRIGSHLGDRIAVIDTERGSASKYADKFEFDVMELDSFHPQKYIDGIKAAEAEGYDVLIIDSLSHAWMGKD